MYNNAIEWSRFRDDCFLVLSLDVVSVEGLRESCNSAHATLKFKLESSPFSFRSLIRRCFAEGTVFWLFGLIVSLRMRSSSSTISPVILRLYSAAWCGANYCDWFVIARPRRISFVILPYSAINYWPGAILRPWFGMQLVLSNTRRTGPCSCKQAGLVPPVINLCASCRTSHKFHRDG
jgi:hypothetical protein